ncbi:unnamed protein product [Brassicogethes aeneus]|uniref:Uncharacterized protein n=1 Tax=Brassicogethes aeneus TaxID=1431903 RepID=A0A9P0FAL8_BRAAE|nr:unnamed protein product [Brassicogethes aeneus]
MGDDFLTKKKESVPTLDLSQNVVTSNEEFRRMLEKVPDFKMKPEKVPFDAIKVKDKKFKFKSGKRDLKAMRVPYTFMDPLPVEMSKLNISELAAVSIDWKMLTVLKPKSKVEENYFSRLVELGKLEIKTRAQEKKQFASDPQIRKIKNKSGVVEMRVVNCSQCGEDFCNGRNCSTFGYDAYARLPELPKSATKVLSPGSNEKVKRKVKRRGRSKSKSKPRKSSGKSKSPRRSKSKTKKKTPK